jgi:ADP-ribosylglycohydrolase
MSAPLVDPARIRRAWQGRISGCQLGKPVEILSIMEGHEALHSYLTKAKALPLRDYIPYLKGTLVDFVGKESCKENLTRSEPDDDIMYSVLALMMLEEHGAALETVDVARAWLRYLPAATIFTAEREAYRVLIKNYDTNFLIGGEPSFDLAECSDNKYNEWIGAQIRTDVYGWVCPGRPELAARLATRDAALSHRGEGLHGAAFVAALGAAIPASANLADAVGVARREVPADSAAAGAIDFACSLVGRPDGMAQIRERYADMNAVHTVNNLAIVVLGLLDGEEDFSRAIGETVAAGWDTDCNGATVGGLWGLTNQAIPTLWTDPWQGRVAVPIAGIGELALEDLVRRTCTAAEEISAK